MKIINYFIFFIFLSYSLLWFSHAIEIKWPSIIIKNTSIKTEVTKEKILNFFADYYTWKIPESYKYIKVNFTDVKKWSKLEESLKKLIYLNLINNPKINFLKDKELNAWSFFRLTEKVLKIKISDKETKKVLLNRKTYQSDIDSISRKLLNDNISIKKTSSKKEINQKIAIFEDVYKTLIKWHFNKDNLDEWKIIESAIKWLTKWTDDKHTVYFPPIESQSFSDSLSWDYEWIWAYVDMEKPWSVRIVSPIPWSPSEKAWVKWWDLVIKVNWKTITEKNWLKEVITWIKWPAWTSVILTINRWWKIMDIEVIRGRIIITDIESKILNTTTYYIQIKSFWEHVSDDFKKTVLKLKDNKDINKIIIDLRNNWWGYLSEVAEILSYFIPEWEKTAIVKYHDNEKNYISRWYDLIDFKKYKIIILQNSWTASASEILIWTLKDYYSDIVLIWENTYWKWSVQVIKNYVNWSILKYTIAKWFTWRTITWIDWIWIKPTIKLEFDLDNFNKNWFDNQLDKAIFIN